MSKSNLFFRDKPYRAAVGLGEETWRLFARDAQGQERFLGKIWKQDGFYRGNAVYTDEAPEVKASHLEDAVEGLYLWCESSGYLTPGHEKHLGGSE